MNITECRNRIDEINQKILVLINERAEWALKIGRIKKEEGLPIYDETRELKIVYDLLTKNSGPLNNDAIKKIFTQIIDECRALQSTLYK